MKKENWYILSGFVLVIVLIVFGLPYIMQQVTQGIINQALMPIEESNAILKTEVTNLLHPTPTIIPDPISIVREVRSLARLETIQYTVEKVITAEVGQGVFGFLMGDKLLFVAHGYVIAGIDLGKLLPVDLRIDSKVLYITLPPPEVFVATLENEKSYVYDRQMGFLTHGDPNLETSARKVAETEIKKTAIEDGILEQARVNGENYLGRLIRSLGYGDVIFESATP